MADKTVTPGPNAMNPYDEFTEEFPDEMTDLRQSYLRGERLRLADLRQTYLHWVDLCWVNPRWADLCEGKNPEHQQPLKVRGLASQSEE
jgi:uncharacterized protein YjbI with pentapeptide repeats